jgi:hypothetical protein
MKVQNYKSLEVYWSKKCHAKSISSTVVHTERTLILQNPLVVIFWSVWHISHYKDACRFPSSHFCFMLDCLLALEVMFLITITIQCID